MLCWIAGRNEQRFGTGSARRTVPLKLLYPDAVKASLRQLELDGVRLGLGEGEQTTRNTFYENSFQTGLPLVSIFPQPGLPEGVLTFFIRYAFRKPGRAVPPGPAERFPQDVLAGSPSPWKSMEIHGCPWIIHGSSMDNPWIIHG